MCRLLEIKPRKRPYFFKVSNKCLTWKYPTHAASYTSFTINAWSELKWIIFKRRMFVMIAYILLTIEITVISCRQTFSYLYGFYILTCDLWVVYFFSLPWFSWLVNPFAIFLWGSPFFVSISIFVREDFFFDFGLIFSNFLFFDDWNMK